MARDFHPLDDEHTIAAQATGERRGEFHVAATGKPAADTAAPVPCSWGFLLLPFWQREEALVGLIEDGKGRIHQEGLSEADAEILGEERQQDKKTARRRTQPHAARGSG
jgi:hypothetical protein